MAIFRLPEETLHLIVVIVSRPLLYSSIVSSLLFPCADELDLFSFQQGRHRCRSSFVFLVPVSPSPLSKVSMNARIIVEDEGLGDLISSIHSSTHHHRVAVGPFDALYFHVTNWHSRPISFVLTSDTRFVALGTVRRVRLIRGHQTVKRQNLVQTIGTNSTFSA